MSQQTENKRIVARLYQEVGNEGRLEVLDEITCPDHVEHNPFPGQSQGVEGLKQRVSMVRAAFNPTFTIEHLIAEGDNVAVMWSNQCEHVGEWFGVPPTGTHVTVHGTDIHLLRDGRLAEHWDVVDVTPFLTAVGAMPAPAEWPKRRGDLVGGVGGTVVAHGWRHPSSGRTRGNARPGVDCAAPTPRRWQLGHPVSSSGLCPTSPASRRQPRDSG